MAGESYYGFIRDANKRFKKINCLNKVVILIILFIILIVAKKIDYRSIYFKTNLKQIYGPKRLLLPEYEDN